MKIINEKGKLFGIINLVDLIIILVIAILAFSVCWKIFGSSVTAAVARETTVTITLRTRGAHPRQYDEAVKNLPATLVSGNSYVQGAKLVSIESVPLVLQNPNEAGELVDAVDPTRIDLIFTIEAVVPSGGAITKIGTQEVRAGRDFTVKTRYIEYAAYIETISYADE